ncbi:MAG: hypothetical protein MUP82_00295 [Candidatus Marinimicrobia bacterium]|nr:hypothetical protein [Candidatus Neomarinimicrobiota bacterium]
MNKKVIITVLFITTFIVGIFAGIVVHKFEVFPYKLIRSAFHSATHSNQIIENEATKEESLFYDLWSIGIKEGPSPFNLTEPANVSNPVITAKDITDVNTSYVADPFIAIDNNMYYMFFEVFNWDTYQGDIGYAESNDGYQWNYKNIILDETFHLSYPYIFKWQNEYYLIPESSEDRSVRLYKAVSFPDRWEYVSNLLSGYQYIDPSIVRYNNMWWLFVAVTPDNGVINLYYSNNLQSDWKAHPMNPIVRLDKDISRPAGRILDYNDRLYRLAQDSFYEYGQQVFAYEITELTEKSYSEKIVSETPLITRSGKGWNAAGMHHVDLHKIGDKWIGAVDGKKYSDKINKQGTLPKSH